MIRLTNGFAAAAMAILILGTACNLEESYLPEPKQQSAEKPSKAAPEPVAVSREKDPWTENDASNDETRLDQDDRSSTPEKPDDENNVVADASKPPETQRTNPSPMPRRGPTTEQESQRVLARLGGRTKVDSESGKVVTVWLNRTLVGDYDLKLVENFSELQVLNLTDTRISDKGLAHLYGLKKLRRIYPQGTRITPAGLDALKAELPELRVMIVLPEVSSP